jgi:SAM-dependent methyltransferase
MFAKKVMASMYAKATSPIDLPWHQPEPPQLLVDAVRSRPNKGRALDVGCGAGTWSVYLAKQGFQVTGIDIIPKALQLAAEHARSDRAVIELVEADIMSWSAPAPFDLILDSGCLHSLIAGSVEAYRSRICSWLAPGGDYVLGHWGKRHAFDWRPVGPRRRSREALVELFSPELREHAHHEELMTGVPMPFGPSVLGIGIWFKRANVPSSA